MNKNLLLAAGLCLATRLAAEASFVRLETALPGDSTDVHHLQEVEVRAGRVTNSIPVAVSNITRDDIERENHGRDLPSLLEMQSSVTTTSDAGGGIGYTSLRIRGIDPSRINVTINGIPLNDAESLQPFWVNVGDLASSLHDVQVQRGAGSSTNGAGAFGASLNMTTMRSSLTPKISVNGSYGSWNTHKETLQVGSGIVNEHWTFDARLSNIGSDGYVDRASTSLQSFFTQTGFFSGQTSIKLLVFGGKEKTYHAWNYVSADEIAQHGRRYNSCGEYYDDNGNVRYYNDQNDIYNQLHTQLHLNHTFNNRWRMSAALHFTKGDGYYEEYKTDRTLSEYGLQAWHGSDGSVNKKSDLVRRKHMDNWIMGEMAHAEYQHNRLQLMFGEAFNHYRGSHFGNVTWVRHYTANDFLPGHEYYRNLADKSDMNIYAKGIVSLGSGFSAYADMQWRHVAYSIDGRNDNWDWKNERMQNLGIDDRFDFFNPKCGVNWQMDSRNRLYASYAYVSKEPYRNCYTDGHIDANGNIADYPRPEHLHDLELGYQYTSDRLSAAANIYYMHYRDQLVLTGELNEIGEALTANMKRSYRFGIECQVAWKPLEWLRWDVNATWSRNRICDFVEYLTDDVTYNVTEVRHGDTRISMSPDWIAGSQLTFSHSGFEAALQTKYVGKQYMSNAEVEAHALPSYCVSNLHLSYSWKPRRAVKLFRIGIDLNNLFNREYESNGYAGSATHNGVRYDYAGYSVQAGFNVLGNVSFEF